MTPSWPAWGKSAARYGVGAVVTAAIVTALALPSEPAAWSVVALVVVLGATTGQSVTASVNRMAGSVVGCVTGALIQLGLPWLWLPVRVGLAVVACMLVCRLVRLSAGQRLGMALAGFFVFVPGDEEWQMVGWRLLATLIGIGIALLVVLLVWPASARDRLLDGIDDAVMALRIHVAAAGEGVGGGSVIASTRLPALAPLRPLVSERRYEAPGSGPDAHTFSAMLDGLELASAGAHRLDTACVVGPEGLLRAMALDLEPVLRAIDSSCASISAHLARTGRVEVLDPVAVDADLSVALERLRAAHLTPAADARELRALFGVIESLSLIAQGLAAAGKALASGGTARSKADG